MSSGLICNDIQYSSRWITAITLLTPDDIVELLNFVLTTTYLEFREQVYQQKFGAAMGSLCLLSWPTCLWKTWNSGQWSLHQMISDQKLWKRYADDTLEVIRGGKVTEWSEHLNCIDSTGSITFTHQEETDIPFLDTHIHKTWWVSKSQSLPEKSTYQPVFKLLTHTILYTRKWV